MWEDLDYLSPMSRQRSGELAAFVGGIGNGLVADIGCGWAELLLQTLAENPGLHGFGIDQDPDKIAHARANAGARDLGERVEFVVADAAAVVLPVATAAICIGASQIWGNVDPGALDYAAALTALRAVVPQGGRLVYGEAIWTRPPTSAATAALGGVPSEFLSLAELVELAEAHGFRPFRIGEATIQEWDAFESGYSWGYQKWLMSHPPTHPEHADVQAQADEHRRRWLSGYRGILGMAYLNLIAD